MVTVELTRDHYTIVPDVFNSYDDINVKSVERDIAISHSNTILDI